MSIRLLISYQFIEDFTMDEYYSERDGFLVVPTESLLENEIAEFNVFLRSNGNYVFYRSKNIPFGTKEKFKLIKALADNLQLKCTI